MKLIKGIAEPQSLIILTLSTHERKVPKIPIIQIQRNFKSEDRAGTF